MNLLVSEILPTQIVPERLAPWMDDLDDYLPIATFEEECSDEPETAPSGKRPTWSELLLSTRWGVFVDML